MKGKKKDVWGTRASWVSLTATKDNEEISICLFDNPANPGYPAYWHARGYGLFALNNVGRKSYDPKEPENSLVIKNGETVIFTHMLLIKTGGAITTEDMKAEFAEFTAR